VHVWPQIGLTSAALHVYTVHIVVGFVTLRRKAVDGFFGDGDGTAWVSDGSASASGKTFVGVAFDNMVNIASVAFTAASAGHHDIQVSSVPSPGALTPDSQWVSVGAVITNTSLERRHHNLNTPTVATTGLRVVITGAMGTVGLGELEA